jgi:hypothetical protein
MLTGEICMKRRDVLFVGIGLALGVRPHLALAADDATHVIVNKDPQCSCCEGYADYLRKSGFEVSIVNTHDLPLMNEQYGVPEELQGCHLSTVAGYFVGGHVPVSVLKRLLSEKPSIKGITLPGMPEGSPGMYGAKTAPFKIYAIGDGPPKLYATV